MKLSDIITRRQHRDIVYERVGIDEDPLLFQKLFEYYQPEMPYGIQKAREGDPADWISDRLCEEY